MCPRLRAYSLGSARVDTRSLVRMWLRWASTVRTLTNRRWAISWFVCPRAIKASTSRSRVDSGSVADGSSAVDSRSLAPSDECRFAVDQRTQAGSRDGVVVDDEDMGERRSGSIEDDPAYVREAFTLGAAGYVCQRKAARSSAIASTPFVPGMATSITTMSGARCSTIRSASRVSPASPTTRRSGLDCRVG